MFNSNVQPRRRIRARPTAWHCSCGVSPGLRKLNEPHLMRCPMCGEVRHRDANATTVPKR